MLHGADVFDVEGYAISCRLKPAWSESLRRNLATLRIAA